MWRRSNSLRFCSNTWHRTSTENYAELIGAKPAAPRLQENKAYAATSDSQYLSMTEGHATYAGADSQYASMSGNHTTYSGTSAGVVVNESFAGFDNFVEGVEL